MAVVPYVEIDNPLRGNGVRVIQWPNMKNTDTGEPLVVADHADVSIQLTGNLGGAGACLIKGANHPSSPTWQTLNDPHENTLNITSLKVEQILESPYQIRPEVSGDGVTDLTPILKMKRVS